MTFTYQHTCELGQPAYIMQRAPFRAAQKVGKTGLPKMPFLGEGYYFWEENQPQAHEWGQTHYKHRYNIVEYTDLKIDTELLLDFMNRRHMDYFKELRQFYIDKSPEMVSWNISQWIEFLKDLNKKKLVKFPFQFFRANELEDILLAKSQEPMPFVTGLQYYANLNPRIVLCITDKKFIACSNRKIIH